MLPIPIRGEGRDCNWGIWVEVNAFDFKTAWDRSDDTDQAGEPPFPRVLANSVSFAAEIDHAFAQEQRDGVFPERRLEWLMQRAHA